MNSRKQWLYIFVGITEEHPKHRSLDGLHVFLYLYYIMKFKRFEIVSYFLFYYYNFIFIFKKNIKIYLTSKSSLIVLKEKYKLYM